MVAKFRPPDRRTTLGPMPYTARLGRQIMAPVSAPARDRLPGRRVKRLSTGLVVPAIVFVWPSAAAPRWFEHERHGGSVLILPDLANDNCPSFGSLLQPLPAARTQRIQGSRRSCRHD